MITAYRWGSPIASPAVTSTIRGDNYPDTGGNACSLSTELERERIRNMAAAIRLAFTEDEAWTEMLSGET